MDPNAVFVLGLGAVLLLIGAFVGVADIVIRMRTLRVLEEMRRDKARREREQPPSLDPTPEELEDELERIARIEGAPPPTD